MIRVLHVLGGLNLAGAETMVMNLYRAVDRAKIQFDFIIHTSEKQVYEDEISVLGGKIYRFPQFEGKNLIQVVKNWNHFFLEHPEYRILHSHVRSYASIYIPIAQKHGVKTIIHSHSTSNGSGIVSVVKGLLQYPLRYQADYLMACSNEAGKWLYGQKACKKSNYVFMPNAIDTEKYRFSETVAAAYRRELGLEDKFVLGHVGRFHEAKNHMFLLDVFAGVCARCSDAMLLLVGDGELREKILAKIKALELEERVVLTGSRNDVPKLMQAMDVFVFPSVWEGLPVTVVEAQATGLPCFISEKITTDVDVSELIKRLPIGDPDLWVQALMGIDTTKKDVTESIKAAGFDIEDTADVMMSFYHTLGG